MREIESRSGSMASEVDEAWGIVLIMFSGRCNRVVGNFDFAVRFVGNVGSRQCNFAVKWYSDCRRDRD